MEASARCAVIRHHLPQANVVAYDPGYDAGSCSTPVFGTSTTVQVGGGWYYYVATSADGAYELVVEGKGDRQYTLDLITEGRPRATEKAWMMRVHEGRLTLGLQFDEGGVTSQYRRKTVRVPMDF